MLRIIEDDECKYCYKKIRWYKRVCEECVRRQSKLYMRGKSASSLIEKNKQNPLFYAIIANIISDGHLNKWQAIYGNKEKVLVIRFINNFEKVFNKKLKIYGQYRTVHYGIEFCKYLSKYTNLNNLVFSNDKQRIEFLTSCFNDEGSVSIGGGISILQKDMNYILLIKKLLSDIGITKITFYSIYNKKYQRHYYALYISKRENRKFIKFIKFYQDKKSERLMNYVKNVKSYY